MFARVSVFESPELDVDEAIRMTKAEILPIERSMDGFRGLILLVDREALKLVSVTLWDSDAVMHSSDDSARTIMRLAAQTAGGKRRSTEHFEVAVFEQCL